MFPRSPSFMSSPTYFPEGSVPHAQDPLWRSLHKINGALYDLVGLISTMPTYFPEGNIPAPQDTPGRSLHKIAGLLSGLAVAGAGLSLNGNGSPEGVVTAPVGWTYIQLDSPGTLWTKVSGSGNTGWAVNS